MPPAGSPPHISAAQLPADQAVDRPEYARYEDRSPGLASRNLHPPIYATDFRRGTLEPLRAQVTAYAGDAQAARTDAQDARVLAAGADRDASDVRDRLRAHTQVLNALRQTQLEESPRMDSGFGRLAAGMEGITTLLNQIIERDQ